MSEIPTDATLCDLEGSLGFVLYGNYRRSDLDFLFAILMHKRYQPQTLLSTFLDCLRMHQR